MKTIAGWLCVCLALTGLGCCDKPHEKEVDVNAETAAIRQADIDLDVAVFERDLDRFKSLIADDGAFYDASGIAVGPDGVGEAWAVFFDPESDVRLRWAPDEAEVSGDGSLGFTRGQWQMSFPGDDGKTAERSGWYVTIWRKNAQGRWQVAVDIGNPRESSD